MKKWINPYLLVSWSTRPKHAENSAECFDYSAFSFRRCIASLKRACQHQELTGLVKHEEKVRT